MKEINQKTPDKIENAQTISSRQIAEMTGKLHYHVLKKMQNIINQLKDKNFTDTNFCFSEYIDNSGKKNPEITMTKSGSLFIASRYDVNLHLAVQKRWEELEIKENDIPKNFAEALLLASHLEEQKQQALLQVSNLNTVLDNLLNWVSIIKIAKHNNLNETYFNWRFLKIKSQELGYTIKKAESPRFGYQNLYHLIVFKACYPELNYNLKRQPLEQNTLVFYK
jgi:Rha family phage regulatory protein